MCIIPRKNTDFQVNSFASIQAFNVVNGDVVTWRTLWPSIAEYFGLKTEKPGEESIVLEELMKDKEPVWEEIVKKHGLQVNL